ncbi:uncharacterized protein LOC120652096 [Panicum virgatum]|uniref:uncharacterized protein LOC120652096 n=1 Tax=Panicum virgatum TaxID=38727 RepID=UPI0019D5CC43|nr:uncharacterized protein LOC120652096 [Panicum virgatum]
MGSLMTPPTGKTTLSDAVAIAASKNTGKTFARRIPSTTCTQPWNPEPQPWRPSRAQRRCSATSSRGQLPNAATNQPHLPARPRRLRRTSHVVTASSSHASQPPQLPRRAELERAKPPRRTPRPRPQGTASGRPRHHLATSIRGQQQATGGPTVAATTRPPSQQ